jgi:hypothetical protein
MKYSQIHVELRQETNFNMFSILLDMSWTEYVGENKCMQGFGGEACRKQTSGNIWV